MTSKAELIILSYTKFGENSIVLHTVSEEYGRRGFLVRVSSKTPMAWFLPLNIVEAEITQNPKSSLWYARNFTSRTFLEGIRGDIRKNTITLFLSEVLFRVIKEENSETGLTPWLKKQILTLDALQSDYSNFHLLFLLEFCGMLGFGADIGSLSAFCGPYLRHTERLLTLPYSEALLYPLRGSDRTAIARNILKYIEYHTESTVNVRSLDVLGELFA